MDLLLVEELLQIHAPLLATTPLDLTIAYSEKKESLEIILENRGEAVNLLDKDRLPDELGLNIIIHLAEQIDYQRNNGINRVTVLMKRG